MSVFHLAVEGTLRKRKSSILIFLVLLITFSFAIVSLSLVGSIGQTNAQFRLNTYGQWYFAIPSGMKEDAVWLQGQKWITNLGVSQSYGTLQLQSGLAGFGTLDEVLKNLGRLSLDCGHFPEQDNEIALEADVLNSLGYDYTLGQEVTLSIDVPYKDQTIPVERTYILCGVLHEYSNLWLLNRNKDNRLLVSAVVTESAAESVLASARNCITTPANRLLVASIPQYFLEVEQEYRETARDTINSYLVDTRTEDFGDKQVCENSAAYPDTEAKNYDNFYVYMIAVITFVAVLCVSIMQFPNESHRFTILRSIGMTKRQLALLITEETLLLSVPAILTGIPCGAGLTWLALRLMLYSGSVPIQVAIPFEALGVVILLWLAAVLVSRMALFLVAVQTPLTGRMQLQTGKSRWIRRLRSMLIVLLVAAFGVTVIFTAMESVTPAYLREYWRLCPSYTIWKNSTVSAAEANLIRQIPGISRVDGFGEIEISLSYSGLEEKTVWIYAIDEEGWRESLDFADCREDFQDGSLVLLCFPEFSEEEYPLPKDTITLRVPNSAGDCLTESEVAVCVRRIPENAMNRGLHAFWEPYTVFCSETYLKKLLDSMEPRQRWDKYIAGGTFGYDRVYVTADLNSDYLSTDVAMTEFCIENGLSLDNRRQEFQARVQDNVQTLILLYSSGTCISLVVLLILASALSLETEQEKFRYGILRAIGMSRRQMKRQIFRKAFARSFTAVLVGWILYGGYSVIRCLGDTGMKQAVSNVLYSLKYNGCGWTEVLTLSAVCLLVPLMISLSAKYRLKKGDLVL